MPLDSRGRALGSMIDEMKAAYLGKLVRVDGRYYSAVGIVVWIKHYHEHFGGSTSMSDRDPIIMRVQTRESGTLDFYVKPARIEVWGES